MRSHSKNTRCTRALTCEDSDAALGLYKELTAGPTDVSPADFFRVIEHPGTTIFGTEADGEIVAMVTLHILPNVTWAGRPYALIENVITSAQFRDRGLGKTTMNAAIQTAKAANCYKIMLLTGQARGAKGFYEACGFNDNQKHGMIMRFIA